MHRFEASIGFALLVSGIALLVLLIFLVLSFWRRQWFASPLLVGFLVLIYPFFLWLAVLFYYIGDHWNESKRTQSLQAFPAPITFASAQLRPLPAETAYAQKRGFGDFNGDGLEDMIEIRDEVWWGQDYQSYIFYGKKSAEGKLIFEEKARKIKLPTTLAWFSSQTKLDVADVNGDGFSDVIFSQYTEGYWKSDLKFAFALNNHHRQFILCESKMLYSENSFAQAVRLIALKMLSASQEDDNLDDYLKMDWADINGDGTDDLVMMWLGGELEVIYTAKSDLSTVIFDKENHFSIPEWLHLRDIRHFDTEDFDGDGRADLFIRAGLKQVSLGIALNRGDHFEPHQDFKTEVPWVDYFGFSKFDTFDTNLDGRADLVKVGRQGSRPVMYCLEVQP